MEKTHGYSAKVTWTGIQGAGTLKYSGYERSHQITVGHKPIIEASSDSAFMGDASKYNPEELLVASLASCHMLWYLHLCADHSIIVMDYTDEANGVMVEDERGGRFISVVLNPVVKVTDAAMIEIAISLHDLAHQKCFIANSCNFPVRHQPSCIVY